VVEAFIATLAEPERSLDSLPEGSSAHANGAGAPGASADVEHGEQALPPGQRNGGAVTGTATEQS
jgi:hypothetical protein